MSELQRTFDTFARLHGKRPAEAAAFAKEGTTVASYLASLHSVDCRDESSVARDAHKEAFHPPKGKPDLGRRLRAELTAALKDLADMGLVGIGQDARARLPVGAVILEFSFTLERKFLSRDDSVFYPNDNPVRKEKIFAVPMTSGSSWKGNLRAAAVENLLLNSTSETNFLDIRRSLIDIFGDEKGEDEEERDARELTLVQYLNQHAQLRPLPESRKGRLRFLPTYYDKVDLDVINPRDRKTRAGTLPIIMEIVPPGATGRFGLIYFPFDILASGPDVVRTQAIRDWKLIADALTRMFRISGFGAKKTSGCGKASEAISAFRFESRLPGFQTRAINTFGALASLTTAFGTPQ
jgi:CRISPR/Cas system CSM-associated protein Csm3 (group 7 of RAMP superfamily)